MQQYQNKTNKYETKNNKRKFDKITPGNGMINYERDIIKKIKLDDQKKDKLKILLEQSQQNVLVKIFKISSNGKSRYYKKYI